METVTSADPVVIKPPVRNEGDDPRSIVYINVDQIVVDPNVQRRIDRGRLAGMGAWQWALAEGLTLALRADGLYVAVEGQHRVLKRQKENPGTSIWGIVSPSPAEEYTSKEAKDALGIARGRKRHSMYDFMHGELAAGDPYWHAAAGVMLDRAVEFASNAQYTERGVVRGIAAVGAVGTIMHLGDKLADLSGENKVAYGARLLDSVLSILTTAYEEGEKGMWDRTLMLSVANILHRNAGVADHKRLTVILAKVKPADWIAECRRRRGRIAPVEYLAGLIMQDYNHSLQATRRLHW